MQVITPKTPEPPRRADQGLLREMLFADRYLSADIETRFARDELAGNSGRIAAATPLLALLHAGHVTVLSLFGPDDGPGGRWRWWLILVHSLMLLGALSLAWYARHTPRTSRGPSYLFVGGYLVFSAWVAGVDQLVTSNITPFTVTVFGTCTLVPLSLAPSVLFLGVAYLALAASLFGFAPASPSLTSNLLNGATIVTAGWVIGRALRSARAKNAAQATTIEQQRAALEAANTELRLLADLDTMTGVPNRRSLLERAARMRAHAARHGEDLAMLMIDVDRFKEVNDRFGHARGDSVLIEVVAACRQELRGEDVLGRIGGEEFVALLPQCDAAGVLVAAERMRARVERLGLDHPRGTPVTVSVGVSLVSVDVGQPDDVALEVALEAADVSLYTAKDAGRNRVGPLAPVTPAHSAR